MSKKVRGSSRNRRGRGRERNVARQRAQIAPPSQPSTAEVIADDIEESESSEAAAEPQQAPRAGSRRQRARAGGVLAARAASEYLYVAQDMRRILAVAGSLFATLVVLWLLIVVMRVIPLPFY